MEGIVTGRLLLGDIVLLEAGSCKGSSDRKAKVEKLSGEPQLF